MPTLQSAKTREADALRLVLLYALRYERHPQNDLRGLLGALDVRQPNDGDAAKQN